MNPVDAAKAQPKVAWLPITGGALATLALAITTLSPPPAPNDMTPPYALGQPFPHPAGLTGLIASIAIAVLAAALVGRARQMVSSGNGKALLLAGAGAGALAFVWMIQVANHSEYAAAPLLVLLAGWLLIAASIWRGTRFRSKRTPWSTIAGGPTSSSQAGAAAYVVGPALLGVALLVAAEMTHGSTSPLDTVELVGGLPRILVIAAVFVIAPLLATGLLIYLIVRLTRSRGAAPLAGTHPQAEVAAHLHDSVLQELAIIRRRADDPDAVRALARTAERDLRDWLSGADNSQTSTLTQAIKQVARQVEDETPGAEIDVIGVRNTRLDDPTRSLVEATREAVRNAVRHGSKTTKVFTEVGDEGEVTIYIRDTGDGFDPDAVPTERRGVRDAIIGRMEAVGGSAQIETGPDGTEVTLRLPPPDHAT